MMRPTMSLQQLRTLLLFLILLSLICVAQGAIGSDGLCPLFVFVPFTYSSDHPAWTLTLQGNETNQGFSHMSVALLAIDHFNNRNSTVVPELSNFPSCNVRFDVNQSRFLDTGSVTHLASRSFVEQDILPCAIAGPFNDLPALDLGVLAFSYKIPMVAHRAYNIRVASGYHSPFTAQVFPTTLESGKEIIEYLQFIGRTGYIALLYSLTDTGLQRREAFSLGLDKYDAKWMTSAYANSAMNQDGIKSTPLDAMKRVKESGYRTIVVAVDDFFNELQPLADAAEELGMNEGDYFWVWYDIFDTSFLLDENRNENTTKLLQGSAWLAPLSPAFLDETDPFTLAWKSQGKPEVDRLNAANPIEPGQLGYIFAGDDWFQETEIEWGSSLMYDAVMAVGIGACSAEQANDSPSSTQHLEHIRDAVFSGASGRVSFGQATSLTLDEVWARTPSTMIWSAMNVLPPGKNESEGVFIVTHLNSPEPENGWEELTPFFYRDGRTVPPDLLRDVPDQNYLDNGLRIMGLVLMSLAISAASVCAIWIFRRREHRVLKASQPFFLQCIAFGTVVQASAIFAISNDESYGWTAAQLSSACMAVPWLLCLGLIVVYSTLFTKLWRVNKVLQFSRRRIQIRHVVGPMAGLMVSALLVLSLWNGLFPLSWERIEINSITGETIGRCQGDHALAFLAPLIVLILVPALLTAFTAWKTIDVNEEFAESKWIFILMLTQLEVVMVAVPVAVVLQDVSTNGRYIGLTFMFWTFPMTTLSLILFPKYLAYRRAVRGVDTRSQSKRGERSGTKVTGLPNKESKAEASSLVDRLSQQANETEESTDRRESPHRATAKTSTYEAGTSSGSRPKSSTDEILAPDKSGANEAETSTGGSEPATSRDEVSASREPGDDESE